MVHGVQFGDLILALLLENECCSCNGSREKLAASRLARERPFTLSQGEAGVAIYFK